MLDGDERHNSCKLGQTTTQRRDIGAPRANRRSYATRTPAPVPSPGQDTSIARARARARAQGLGCITPAGWAGSGLNEAMPRAGEQIAGVMHYARPSRAEPSRAEPSRAEPSRAGKCHEHLGQPPAASRQPHSRQPPAAQEHSPTAPQPHSTAAQQHSRTGAQPHKGTRSTRAAGQGGGSRWRTGSERECRAGDAASEWESRAADP